MSRTCGLIVLKVGGSLIPAYVAPLCAELNRADGADRLLVVAGGGEIADVVRGYRRALRLSDAATFAMALLSMDQHAFLLAELGGFPLIHSLDELDQRSEPVCVLAPAADIRRKPWACGLDIDRVTSDAVAAVIAARLGAALVIATDVDGIYDKDPREAADAKLLERVAADALLRPSSIDVEAARIIRRFRLDAVVLNGMVAGRLADHLAGVEVPATRILPAAAGDDNGFDGAGDDLVDR